MSQVAGRQAHVPHAPAQARTLSSPLDLSDADLSAGQATYESKCAGCHGRAGKGGAPPAAGRRAPADLTRPDLRTRTDGEIYWVIANGIAASGMPAATDLSDMARWQLVAWVRNLGGLKAPVRATDGGASYVWDLPPGFPQPKVPADNPMTPAKVELGRYLFYDPRFSLDGTFSCGNCHDQKLAFTDGKAFSTGVTGDVTPRSAMALHNVAYAPVFTWANPTVRRLETQALVPMFGEDPVELGLSGLDDKMLARLAAEPRYPKMFAAAFPGDPVPISLANVTRAIASFERTLLSGRSAYDLYRTSADPKAWSPAALRGEDLFSRSSSTTPGSTTSMARAPIPHPTPACTRSRKIPATWAASRRRRCATSRSRHPTCTTGASPRLPTSSNTTSRADGRWPRGPTKASAARVRSRARS